MNKPNFFIIGAPKCGTTSLASWLSEHPHVYMSPVKEPHYYADDFGYSDYRAPEKYFTLFRDANADHLAIGEASATYLYSESAVPKICEDISGAKFIVLLRTPLEMAPSLHQQFYFDGAENTKSFEEAWRVQNDRRNGRRIPFSCQEPAFLLYKDACSLGKQLERLYTRVSERDVLPILLEDVQSDPRSIWLQIMSFLGLPDDGRTSFPVKNVSKQRRFRQLGYMNRIYTSLQRHLKLPPLGLGVLTAVDQANIQKRLRQPLSAEMSQELIGCFSDDVRLLGRLLNRDLEHWLNPAIPVSRDGNVES